MNITLLAVCGLNPQVITETVYALAQQQRCPARIRVITTRKGRDAILSQLFDDAGGLVCPDARFTHGPGTN